MLDRVVDGVFFPLTALNMQAWNQSFLMVMMNPFLPFPPDLLNPETSLLNPCKLEATLNPFEMISEAKINTSEMFL